MSHASLVTAPFFLPLIGALLLLLSRRARTIVTALFLLLHLVVSVALLMGVNKEGAIAVAAGGWLAPYGIVLVADRFSALLLVCSSLLFLCSQIGQLSLKGSYTHSLLLLLQSGVALSFLTGDLFNLFVAFELMLMASYALICSVGDPAKQERSFSYLAMNVTASFFYLIAVAVTYGTTGQLNFAALSVTLEQADPLLRLLPMGLILLVMMIKGGVFPLYFWLPDAYPILPPSLAALFAGTLSKVGIYVIYRLLLSVYPEEQFLTALMLLLACCTMFMGVMGAVSQKTVQGILAYHTLSQVGYILLALSLGSPLAIATGLFLILHNMVVKASLFFIGGVASEASGSDDLSKMGGLWVHHPFLGGIFLLQALSLAGIPPLSGFWGKFLLFFEGMTLEAYLSITVALFTSFYTLFSMIKIWNGAFLGDASERKESPPKIRYAVPVFLTVTALALGVGAEPFLEFSQEAANDLMNKELYREVCLEVGYRGEAIR